MVGKAENVLSRTPFRRPLTARLCLFGVPGALEAEETAGWLLATLRSADWQPSRGRGCWVHDRQNPHGRSVPVFEVAAPSVAASPHRPVEPLVCPNGEFMEGEGGPIPAVKSPPQHKCKRCEERLQRRTERDGHEQVDASPISGCEYGEEEH